MPRTPQLSIELLQTFVVLMDYGGNAIEAAEALQINQPSMSKRLSHLQHPEKGLTRPLLVREGKRWTLTAEGQAVLPVIRGMLQQYQRLNDYLAEGSARLPDVRLGCGQEAARGMVLEAVVRFRRIHPQARLHILTDRGADRIKHVATDALDLAIVLNPLEQIEEQARRKLYVEQLLVDPLVLAVGQKAPLEIRQHFATLPSAESDQRVPVERLADFPLLLPGEDASVRQSLNKLLAEEGLTHAIDKQLEGGGWPTILEYVRAGVGVGLVGADACRRFKSKGILYSAPLDTQKFPPAAVRLIARFQQGTSGDPDLTAAEQQFCQCLRDVIRETVPPTWWPESPLEIT